MEKQRAREEGRSSLLAGACCLDVSYLLLLTKHKLVWESVLSRHTIPLDTSCENIKQQAIVSTHFPHIAPVKTVHAQT